MQQVEHSEAPSAAQKRALETQFAIRAAMNRIRHKILVLSGKGGVGKSTIAVNLAYGFADMGYSVGLLDIDNHGPSIGKMTGIEGDRLLAGDNNEVTPIIKGGVKIISMASLLPPDDVPVIWRGPMKMTAVDQFLSEISWGDLDILVIDSPPGTGDEPLSIVQRLPELDGAVIVTTPQDVALADAKRTVNFARQLGVSVLGIIENMSGFVCPHCGNKTDIFKTGGGEEAARAMGLDMLGVLPIEPAIMNSSDDGIPFITGSPDSESSKIMSEIVRRVAARIGLTSGGAAPTTLS